MERGVFQVQHFLLVMAIPGRGVFCGFCKELVGFPAERVPLQVPLPLRKAAGTESASLGWQSSRVILLGECISKHSQAVSVGGPDFLKKKGTFVLCLNLEDWQLPACEMQLPGPLRKHRGLVAFLRTFLWSKGRQLLGETSKAGENTVHL